jgi:hypothetical protein
MGMETAVKKSLTTELPTAVAGGSNADLFVIAEIRDFPTLLAAMRKRVADLRTTYDCVDDAAFLATGYTNRLLRRYPEKRMSPQTFGGLLLGLGCKLLLVQDDEVFAKVRDKLRPSKWPGAHPWLETGGKRLKRADTGASVPARKRKENRGRRHWKGNSQWGKDLRLRQLVLITPKLRSKMARNAIRKRWSKAKRRKVRKALKP